MWFLWRTVSFQLLLASAQLCRGFIVVTTIRTPQWPQQQFDADRSHLLRWGPPITIIPSTIPRQSRSADFLRMSSFDENYDDDEKRDGLEDNSSPSSSKSLTEISNLKDLNQQLQRFQYERRPTPSSSPPSSQSSNTMKRRSSPGSTGDDDNTDDDMAEWRELQRQIEEEERLLQRDLSNTNIGNLSLLPSILEEARERNGGASDEEQSTAVGSDPFNGKSRFDEVNLPPGARPSRYEKTYITDFEIADDGSGVYLSPEAYQQASQSAANPDGSLNLATGPNTIFSPSVLEAVTARPEAPYYDTSEKDDEADDSSSGSSRPSKKPITLEDLSEQARKAKEYLQQNPDAQEELHQRIMAEEEETVANDDDSPSSKLFQEAMTDPEKARQFWNQGVDEARRQETEALEKLLDERLQWFKDMSAQQADKARPSMNYDPPTAPAVLTTTQARNQNKTEPMYVPNEDEKAFLQSVEQDRLQHANNVANYYSYDSNDWKEVLEGDTQTVEGDGRDRQGDGSSLTEKGQWISMEDPSMADDDPFYWNTETEEMRWDPPEE